MTIEEYILKLDAMTTKEFCEEHGLPLPIYTGNVKTAATAFIQIDAFKFRLIKEFVKSNMNNHG